jgi:uncharacterized protein (TIGR03118 family)
MSNIKHHTSTHHRGFSPRWGAVCGAVLALASTPMLANPHGGHHGGNNGGHHGGDEDGDHGGGQGQSFYQQTNLVSNLSGVAQLQDTNLLNAWGIGMSTNSPFWVSANHSGLALLYAVTNGPGGNPVATKLGLQVQIPGDGAVSGQLFNNFGGFNGDVFIFATEGGTIAGWRPALSNAAEVLTVNSNAIYKGITIVPGTNGPLLLAANFGEGKIDAYDTNLTLVQYSDPTAPTNYAPFNIQALGGMVFVTFAKQKAGSGDDDAGPGHGIVSAFDPATHMFHRLVTGSDAGGSNTSLNSPWGLAISPQGFGANGDQLLVGNFGSGAILAFEPNGHCDGTLKDSNGQPIVIPGLWALTFGNGGRGGVPGALYFTAGPDEEANGLFGSLVAVRTGGGNGNDDDDHGHGHGDDNGQGDDNGHGHGNGNGNGDNNGNGNGHHGNGNGNGNGHGHH